MLKEYGKTTGHHCWWLTINGKSVANFDDESDVDGIIEMSKELEQTAIKLNECEQENITLKDELST